MAEEKRINDSISVRLTYPYSDKYEFKTELVKIDLDKERIDDLKSGKGFPIESSRSIKIDVKNQTGIFSSRYGSTSIEIDSFNGKYRCKCGMTKGSIMHGEVCPVCGTIVKFMDNDVTIFGWLILKEKYFVIHPNIYATLEGFIGDARLDRIIQPEVTVDSDGKIIQIGNPTKKDEPFKGIGMFEFRRRYDEILQFYLKKYPSKKSYYDELMRVKDITFTHSIPVFSSLLRPSSLDSGNTLRYETTNEYFMMLAKLVKKCNRDKLKMDQKEKEKLSILYDAQTCYNLVYKELKECLAKKKGDIQTAIGGRYSFSSRSVIRQDPKLRAYEIRLPFHGLLELMQQVIINILVRTHNMKYSDAYKKWYKAQVRGFDQTIYDILQGLIHDNNGINVLINRNPTISFGGILACKCIGINMDYTMSISLLILKLLAADFDGDTLNILMLYNKEFIEITSKIFNPEQMYISRNDGLCNSDLLPSRDMLINTNALKSVARYTQKEIDQIKMCMSQQ